MKLPFCTATYSRSGALIAGGCQDGSLQIWDVKAKSLHRPQVYIKDAHLQGEITFIKVFKDEKRLATRSMDDTLKLWDIRNTKHPFQEWKDLTCIQSKTGITLSPDEKLVLTGTSVRKGFGHGMLMGFEVATGEEVCKTPISTDSVVTVFWHPALNQIIVGSADANIRVLYDPEKSVRGITSSLTKLEKRRPIDQNMQF